MSAVVGKILKKSLTTCNKVCSVRSLNLSKFKVTEKDVQEIKIPVPWGHIAGKWWGDKHTSPVIAIHGWQDNANSFDELIPLLNAPSVVAIDLPGHGRSSHLPEGRAYDFGEHIILLHRIKKHFNFEQMPLLTHSLGAAIGFVYASMFPQAVKWLVNLECGRTLLTLFRQDIQSSISEGIDAFLKIEKQKKNEPPPTYKLSKMIEMSIEGSLGSIASPQAAITLLKRGIYAADKQPAKHSSETLSDLSNFISYEAQAIRSLPEKEKEHINKIFFKLMQSVNKLKEDLKTFHLEEDNTYYAYTRDPSIKVLFPQSFNEEFITEAAKNIKCPVLSVRAKQGFLFGSTRKLYEKSLDILKSTSSYFEHHDIEGTHHAHLNTPKLLAPLINTFIENVNLKDKSKISSSIEKGTKHNQF